nr:MBL fold metallo-hydrolase [Chloroflexia bacterium]
MADRAPAPLSPLTVQSLGSGSSGNALLVEYGATAVLVDCGVGIRELGTVARHYGRALDSLDAVLVTHEHVDHIRSLGRVTDGATPVVASAGTAKMAGIRAERHVLAVPDRPVSVGALTVWTLPVRHDALDPCGFFIETPGGNLTVLTDLGCWRDNLADALRHSDLIVLEANHDLEMLHRGPYPPHLKRRVASDVGH